MSFWFLDAIPKIFTVTENWPKIGNLALIFCCRHSAYFVPCALELLNPLS